MRCVQGQSTRFFYMIRRRYTGAEYYALFHCDVATHRNGQMGPHSDSFFFSDIGRVN